MTKSIFVLIVAVTTSAVSLSQWQSDVRLTNNASESYTPYNNGRCISVNGNIVHVVWFDDRDGNFEIYYKRSPDEGLTWGQDTRLTNNSAISELPALSVTASTVQLVWDDNRDGNREIYYKRSTDAGVSWSSDVRLTNNTAISRIPCITSNGTEIHIVWEDDRDGNFEVYYKRSPDGGLSWGQDSRLTNNSALSRFAAATVSASSVHLVWDDDRDGNRETYYKRSTDGGQTWGPDTRLTFDGAISGNPTITINGSVLHVFWHDNRSGNYDIYYKRSPDGGVSWSQDTRFTANPSSSFFATVAASGSYVHMTWMDNRDGNDEIYYSISTNNGLNWNADIRLTNNSAESAGSHIAVSGSALHIVWNDDRDGNYEMYYKRNPTGNPVGVTAISGEIVKEFRLSQNYPNPFNPKTVIKMQIADQSIVTLKVFDLIGNEAAVLVNGEMQPGTYEVDFDGANYPSGVYFYTITAGSYSDTRKMVLVK